MALLVYGHICLTIPTFIAGNRRSKPRCRERTEERRSEITMRNEDTLSHRKKIEVIKIWLE